jgi:hypothetical protein
MVIKVEVDIPEKIVQTCLECGFNEEQTKKVYLHYLGVIVKHPYNQFEIDFENWLNEDCEDDDVLSKIITNK